MHRLEVRTQRRTELVDITAQVKAQVAGGGVRAGVCQVFVPHTTAAVTINENSDPDVPQDILRVVDALIPFDDPGYRHVEGNSAAHVKATLVGASVTVPVEAGQLVLGTWQATFLSEFDGPRRREVWVQVMGAT